MPNTHTNADELSEDLVQGTCGRDLDGPDQQVAWKVQMFINAPSIRQARSWVVKALMESPLSSQRGSRALRYRFEDMPCDESTHCIPIDMMAVYSSVHEAEELMVPMRTLKNALRRTPSIMNGHIDAVGVFDGWNRFEPWPEPRATISIGRTRARTR